MAGRHTGGTAKQDGRGSLKCFISKGIKSDGEQPDVKPFISDHRTSYDQFT